MPAGAALIRAAATAVILAGMSVPAAAAAPGGPARGAGWAPAGHRASWTAAAIRLPADAMMTGGARLSGTACPATGTCTAAGSYLTEAGHIAGLLATGYGQAWTVSKAPVPAGTAADAEISLGAVTCPAATSCVAAGLETGPAGGQEVLLETGHGAGWTATRVPLPAGADSTPNAHIAGVACQSASDCVAVGSYRDSDTNYQGLLVTGHGQAWTASTAPLPAGAPPGNGPVPAAVACSAASCAVAGSYTSPAGSEEAILLAGHGTAWTAARAPLPAGAARPGASTLTAIACSPASSACAAAGSYTSRSGARRGLLLARHRSSWTASRAPLPPGAAATQAEVTQVACPAAAGCLAAGSYLTPAGTSHAFLLAGYGTAWTARAAPVPADTGKTNPDVSVTGIACASRAPCVAAGSYLDSAGMFQGLLLTRRGPSWTAMRAPLPHAGTAGFLSGVSCTAGSACAAFGSYQEAAGGPSRPELLSRRAGSDPAAKR